MLQPHARNPESTPENGTAFFKRRVDVATLPVLDFRFTCKSVQSCSFIDLENSAGGRVRAGLRRGTDPLDDVLPLRSIAALIMSWRSSFGIAVLC